MTDHDLYQLAQAVGSALKARSFTLAAAESCTGGGVGAAITMVPGSSAWFDRGFITYTNLAKRELLDVAASTLDSFGAVSEQTVQEMVQGALARSRADVAVAVSGIAGPDGGSADKPVGTVCFAWGARGTAPHAQTRLLSGDRESVRRQAVVCALEGVLALLQQ